MSTLIVLIVMTTVFTLFFIARAYLASHLDELQGAVGGALTLAVCVFGMVAVLACDWAPSCPS